MFVCILVICTEQYYFFTFLYIFVFYFQTFLSHKYGYCPFPRCIKADLFELIIKGISEDEQLLIDKYA